MIMVRTLEVLFTPADFSALARRDLSETVCVVFDVLRATSSMVTALAHGAAGIIPVIEIAEATAWRATHPDVLLAGERQGLRIRATQSGGLDFDLGNSPREFTPERVRGKTIVTTTTNGTRALRACQGARKILIGAFLNLEAVARWIERESPSQLILVCSGTFEQTAYEDVLAAGALVARLEPEIDADGMVDSTLMARWLFERAEIPLHRAIEKSRNGRRLLAIPELRDDVAFCAQRDRMPLVAGCMDDGSIRVW
jgi:2-phosphosulfolactate phosphatase